MVDCTTLNELATELHSHCVDAGWWDGYDPKSGRFETAMALSFSELMEGLEGYRKDLMDDHLPHHKMLHVELADCLIRGLDLSGAMNVVYRDYLTKKVLYTARRQMRSRTVPESLFYIIYATCAEPYPKRMASVLVLNTLALCEELRIDVLPIIREKHEYNKHRADHKREARAAKHGKKI